MPRRYTTRTTWYERSAEDCAAIRARCERGLRLLAAEGVTWEWWDVPAMTGVPWLRPHIILIVHWRDRAQFEGVRLRKRIRDKGGSLVG